jgi:hypothetical protein
MFKSLNDIYFYFLKIKGAQTYPSNSVRPEYSSTRDLEKFFFLSTEKLLSRISRNRELKKRAQIS